MRGEAVGTAEPSGGGPFVTPRNLPAGTTDRQPQQSSDLRDPHGIDVTIAFMTTVI
jgi:hypothetical protein